MSGRRSVIRPVADAITPFGGYLRCEKCRTERPLAPDLTGWLLSGWPRCCGYTMRWWTQRQIDAGEHLHPTTP